MSKISPDIHPPNDIPTIVAPITSPTLNPASLIGKYFLMIIA